MTNKNLLKQIRFLIRATGTSSKKVYPEYFRISEEKDLKKFSSVIRRNDLRVYDIKNSVSNRSVSGSEYALKRTNEPNSDVWVYYPWLKELVRFPEREEKSISGKGSGNSIFFFGIDATVAEVAKIMASKGAESVYIHAPSNSEAYTLPVRYENTGLTAATALVRELFEINPFLSIDYTEGEKDDSISQFLTQESPPALILAGSENSELQNRAQELSLSLITLLKSPVKGKISFRVFLSEKSDLPELSETCLAFFDLDHVSAGYTISVPKPAAAVILSELCISLLNYQNNSK